ncbi:hypothetical protein, partial [Aliidiomarina quisquiliarum]|uniref:hypothetical protein n=1 Tax=Aliidiomarina quisquiliarum TaxID=2938947 RepID=UPI00208E3CC9
MFRVIALMILMFSAGSYSAEQSLVKHLDEINAFPIAQQVDRSNDMPVTTIDTGMIRDPNGQLARGPHDVVFTLSSNAAFAVYVEGHKVEPGHTHSMVVNLTSVNHRLILPIYPASNNTTGTVNFELNIPFLNVKVCPEGFQERPGDCYRIEFSEINYICPSDFNFSNSLNDCRRTHSFPLANTCPSGYTQAGDTCTNLLTTDVTFECPSDFYFDGNDCVRKTYESSLVCEVGFDYNSNTGRCQKQVDTYQAQSPCPQGYSSSGDQCIRELSQQPAELLCPDSHSNIDAELNKCFTIQEAPIGHEPPSSENDCWLGYQWLNSQCVEFLEPSLECPNDMQLKDGSCLKLEAIPAGNYCGDTMSLTTECAVYELSDTGAYCSSGYIYQSGDNNCLKIDTAPATRVCVDGYSLSADNLTCERTDLIELEISCPAGMVRSDDGEFCYEEYSQPAVQECPEGAGWTKDGTQCNYFDSDEVSSCPAGYTLRDGSCHRLEVKSQLCSAGYINQGNGTCSRHETQDATPTCGTGYTYNSSTSRCERTDTIDASPQCGTGYTYNSSAGRCERTDTQGASPTCPANYNYNSSTSRCERTDTIDASPQCGTGYTYNSSAGRCERTDTQGASPTCPANYNYNSSTSRCERTNTIDANPVCGSGYTYNAANARCEKLENQAASATCPSGYTYNSAA